MRATISPLALVSAVAIVAAGVVGCSSTIGGRAVCPGCGTAAEPNFPTPAPSVSTPTTPTSESPTAGPTATAAPGPGDEQTLPTDDAGLSRAERREVQTLLVARGHAIGTVDGMLGDASRAAIRVEQQRLGHAVDGRAGQKLLRALKENR